MKYKTGDKLSLKQQDLLIEIVGSYSGAQLNSIPTNGQNYYGVTFNGYQTLINESSLIELTEKIKVIEENFKEVVIEPLPVSEQPKKEEKGIAALKKVEKRVTRKKKESIVINPEV